MKTFFPILLTLSLLLTACGNSITVADKGTIEAFPEQKPVMLAWQGLTEAVKAEDCEAVLSYMRLTLNLEEDVCPAIYAYFKDGIPEVEWIRTDWSISNGKAKIYAVDGGSIMSFIHNEADDSWRSDDKFWE